MTTAQNDSKYWLDLAAAEIIRRYPKGEIKVSSGISPSADYHIGHFREIMTAEALAWAVRQRGRRVTHLHVVDNFDPLRKWYDFLPRVDKDYAGWPVCLVPDPFNDGHASYADHYFEAFEKHLAPMGIKNADLKIVRAYEELYVTDEMTPYIEKVMAHMQKSDYIRRVFEELSNRQLPEDWTPVQVINPETKLFVNGELSTWDKKAQTINGWPYTKGRAKLNWRLDWPARWAKLGVQVEPFGAQEHGAAGGSYDTGVRFAKEVFGVQAPYDAARYGHIHRPGENFKMSSSKGNVVTPDQALDIMPAEVLRYFMVRSRPERKLIFDPGVGLFNLIDEFSQAQSDPGHEFRDAYNFAVAGAKERVISTVPFRHLVQVYQAAQGDIAQVLDILSRTGYEPVVKEEKGVIEAELIFVQNWLANYAPDEIKFEVKKDLLKVELSAEQKKFLGALSQTLDKEKDVSGQRMHELIYAAKDATQVAAPEAFKAIYRVILGQDSGPKAGWFLTTLDHDWLIERLKAGSES